MKTDILGSTTDPVPVSQTATTQGTLPKGPQQCPPLNEPSFDMARRVADECQQHPAARRTVSPDRSRQPKSRSGFQDPASLEMPRAATEKVRSDVWLAACSDPENLRMLLKRSEQLSARRAFRSTPHGALLVALRRWFLRRWNSCEVTWLITCSLIAGKNPDTICPTGSITRFLWSLRSGGSRNDG